MNELAIIKPETQIVEFSAFGNIQHFENAQRMAKALCSSSIVPQNYQGDANLGSCVIALEISNRIGASVLAVMQNLYVVHGKPGWSSQFLISCVNASRKFTPLRYKMTGEKGKDSWGCIAWAQDKSGENLEAPEVTIEMAKAEGWYAKNGSKWKTMPELMLRYRSATLFARLYAPELTMGIQTAEEIQDVIDIEATPEPVKTPSFGGAVTPAKAKKSKPEPAVEAKPIEVKPEPSQPELKVEPPAPAPAAAAAPAADTTFDKLVDLMFDKNIEHAQLIGFCVARKLMADTAKEPYTLSSIRADKIPLLMQHLASGSNLGKEIMNWGNEGVTP